MIAVTGELSERAPRTALRFWRRQSERPTGQVPSTSDVLAPLAEGAALDCVALARWILLQPPHRLDETLYSGVGCTLTDAGAHAACIDGPPRARADAAAALRRELERSIVRAVGRARRVAVLTGGGLDSGGLLGVTAHVMRERRGSAFAVALDYRAEGDDRPYLEALERHLGCDVLRVTPEDGARRAALVNGVDATPFLSPTDPIVVEMFARARAHGAELVLTGDGGDALFDGSPHSLGDLTREGHPIAAIRAARSLRGFNVPRTRIIDWAIRPAVTHYLPRSIRMWNSRRRKPAYPVWAGPVVREVLDESRARDLHELEARLASGAREQEGWPNEHTRVWFAWQRHQQEHVSGIERADPYFDRELVRWVHALPQAWLLEGGIRRGLFREAIRGLVPDSLRLREDKAAFEPAMVRFVESIGGFESFREHARVRRLADLGLVEPRTFEKCFDELAARPIVSCEWSNVWPALAAEAFLASRGGTRG